METLISNPWVFVPVGIALALSICAVAQRLLRLIPQGEATQASYRRLRLWIVYATAILVFAILVAVALGYLATALGGALPTTF